MSSLPVETIKRDSRRLRGTLVESLADPVTGALAEADTVLLKFHGSYQQDDRDIREERRRALLEPDYRFMIRTRTPGGVVSPEQWLKMDAIATRFSTGGLRVTTRQAFQIHGVVKGDLKPTLQAINAALIDTIAACGDVNRNVLASPGPLASPVHAAAQAWAAKLSAHLLPRTRAYHEIWLDGEKVAPDRDAETILGANYLPRKFKAAIAVPPVNDVDVFAQDLGFIAIEEHGRLAGFNLTVGGGMGNKTLSLNGTLPPWLSFNPQTGLLSGTPPQPGTVNFSLTVMDQNACTLTQSYTLNVVCPTVTLTPASLPAATLNTAYPTALSANPAGSYSFSLTSGLLPQGLTLNANGSFSGAPTQSGNFNFRVTATGFSGGFGSCSAFQDYALTVNCPTVSLSPANLPGGALGSTYNQSVSASPAGSLSAWPPPAGSRASSL